MDLKGKWVSDLGNGYFKNPVIYADYSDPDVIRVGEDFYMTASSFTYVPGLPILHSKDLVNWELINYAAKELQSDFDKPIHGCGVWAPSIRYHEGRFYIYYGDPDRGIMMTSTDDIYGEWEPLIGVKEGKGLIDTCPRWDDDGKAYIVHGYAKSRCGFKSKIGLFEMTPDGKKTITEDKIVFDGTISHPTIEGPKFYKRNGYYYIMSPAGGVPTGWQTVLRSKNVDGPYEDRIVLRQGTTDINGPHQGGWIELENGENWFMHFQDLEVCGRIVHLQPVEWINDWPVMGINADSGLCGEPVKICKKPNVGKEYPISVIATSDDFMDGLGLQWQWQANVKNDWFECKNGVLKLNACNTGNNIWHMPNVLTQLWQAPSMRTTVKVSLPSGTGNTKAGLGVIGQDYGYVALRNDGTVEMTVGTAKNIDNNGGANVTETVKAEKIISENSVYLRCEIIAKENAYDCIARVSYSEDGEIFTVLGEFAPKQGRWVGAKHAMFCMGDEGFAEFENFVVD